MNPEIKISFPDEVLDEMTFEQTLFSPDNQNIGIVMFSEVIQEDHILRLYHLLRDETEETYQFVQELAAFSFKSRHEVDDFIQRLPTLSGIEMLLMLNPVTPSDALLN